MIGLYSNDRFGFNEYFVETDELETLWTNGSSTSEFRFSDIATDFGTREMGARIREHLRPLFTENSRIALDFTGVNVVSNSFADECIAKLLLDMPLEELNQRITFRGLNPMAERSILVALQRRNKVLR